MIAFEYSTFISIVISFLFFSASLSLYPSFSSIQIFFECMMNESISYVSNEEYNQMCILWYLCLHFVWFDRLIDQNTWYEFIMFTVTKKKKMKKHELKVIGVNCNVLCICHNNTIYRCDTLFNCVNIWFLVHFVGLALIRVNYSQ